MTKPHWSFWLICSLGLLWNIGGSINYIMQMNLEFVNTLPKTQQAIIGARPIWATGGFAIGVFGGALGCLLLLFKKSLSFYILTISALGIIVTMIHTVNIAISKISFTPSEIIIMVVMPLVVAVSLLWHSKYSENKNWIN